MANMAYCRFYNTRLDMDDCIEALEYGDTLSENEKTACKRMFESILEYLENEGVVEVDYDAFEEWLDGIETE